MFLIPLPTSCKTLNWLLNSTPNLKVTSTSKWQDLIICLTPSRNCRKATGKDLLYFNIFTKYSNFSTWTNIYFCWQKHLKVHKTTPNADLERSIQTFNLISKSWLSGLHLSFISLKEVSGWGQYFLQKVNISQWLYYRWLSSFTAWSSVSRLELKIRSTWLAAWYVFSCHFSRGA